MCCVNVNITSFHNAIGQFQVQLKSTPFTRLGQRPFHAFCIHKIYIFDENNK